MLSLATCKVSAQDDVEYRMEIGAGAGLVGYHGDFNDALTSDLKPMGSVLLRYNLSPYMGFRANLMAGTLEGKYEKDDTYYPDYDGKNYEFSNSLVGLNITYEYNFWPYGTGREYRGAKRLTPFVFGGIGGVFVKTSEKNVFTANVPLGLGVKYKVGARVNLGLEWSMNFTASDELDGVKDPYYIKSSGLFKNTECFSALQLTLTYSFMAKCRTCHNENE